MGGVDLSGSLVLDGSVDFWGAVWRDECSSSPNPRAILHFPSWEGKKRVANSGNSAIVTFFGMVKLRDPNSKVVGLVTSNQGITKGSRLESPVEGLGFPKKTHQKEYPVSMKDIRTHFASSLGCIEPNQD